MDKVLVFSMGVLAVIGGMIWIIYSLRTSSEKSQETRLLHFGAVILTGLALVFLISAAMFFWGQPTPEGLNPGEKIFESCVTIIPPLVTLVLGYYFGKQDNQVKESRKNVS